MQLNLMFKIAVIAAALVLVPLVTAKSIQAASTPSFNVFASPSSLTVQPGVQGNITISVQSLNGFSSPVFLSVPSIPGVSQTFAANPVTPPSNGIIQTQLHILANSSATMQGNTVSITGNSGALVVLSNPVKIVVNCAQFIVKDITTGQLLTEHQTISHGDQVTDTVKLNCVGVFAGAMVTTTTNVGKDPTIQMVQTTPFIVENPAGTAPSSVSGNPYTVSLTNTGGRNTYNNNILLNGWQADTFFPALTIDKVPLTHMHFHVFG